MGRRFYRPKLAARRRLTTFVVAATSLFPGCQGNVAPELPSPYVFNDGPQYYAPGPEFKLAREAAELQAQAAAQESEAQARGSSY
jgi:hypothetical protein